MSNGCAKARHPVSFCRFPRARRGCFTRVDEESIVESDGFVRETAKKRQRSRNTPGITGETRLHGAAYEGKSRAARRVRNSCGARVAQEAQFLTGEVGVPTMRHRCTGARMRGCTSAPRASARCWCNVLVRGCRCEREGPVRVRFANARVMLHPGASGGLTAGSEPLHGTGSSRRAPCTGTWCP